MSVTKTIPGRTKISNDLLHKNIVEVNINVNILTVTKVFFMIVAALSVISFFMKVNLSQFKYIVSLFDVDKEMNFPTYFASFLLLVSSFLFLVISRFKKNSSDKFSKNWLFLSVIFLGLSVDEFMTLHEQTTQLFRGTSVGDFVYFGWLIPASIFLILFTASYIKFFFHLNSRFKKLFLISGVLFCTGAAGFELIGGIYQNYFGQQNLGYFIITNIEEVFEMSGMVLLIYTLLNYIKENKPEALTTFS